MEVEMGQVGRGFVVLVEVKEKRLLKCLQIPNI
jgi:hypothetical protein